MRLSSVIIGILLIAAVSTGMYTFVNSLASDEYYDVAVESKYEDAFGNNTEINQEINASYTNVQAWTVDKTSFLALAPDVVSLVKNLIALPFKVLGNMLLFIVSPEGLGLPVWVQSFAIGLLLTVMIFAVIAIIIRYRYT